VLWNPGDLDRIEVEPCKGGTGILCRPYRALHIFIPTQGFGRVAASALGCSVPRFQRSEY